MKKSTFLTSIVFFLLSSTLQAQTQAVDIIGNWDTQKVQVEIYQVDDHFIGNPIDSEGNRNEKIEVLNLEFEDGQWVGKIYAKRKNKYLDVVCELVEDKLMLEVDAGRFTKKVEWTKIQE